MKHINLEKLASATLKPEPFPYLVVRDFLKADSLKKIIDSYPNIMKGGWFPLDTVEVSQSLQETVDELNSLEFERAVEGKLGEKLKGFPKTYSVRGYCQKSDGGIQTKSKSKLVTVVLFLNDKWNAEGGKLRLLNSGSDFEDYAEEVSPDGGTLVVFKRTDKSFHGHGPHEGVRRTIQMNWMNCESKPALEKFRHTLSNRLKKLAASAG